MFLVYITIAFILFIALVNDFENENVEVHPVVVLVTIILFITAFWSLK